MKVVKAVLKRPDGRVLALRKAERDDFMSGKWELPGGKVESGDISECAKREIAEEIGLNIRNSEELLDIVIREKIEVDCTIVYAEVQETEVELSEEHRDYRWIRPDAFRNLELHRDAAYAIPVLENLDYYRGVNIE